MLHKYIEHLKPIDPVRVNGKVTQVIGLPSNQKVRMRALAMCAISIRKSAKPLKAEVVGFRDNKVILMPLGDLHSIGPGCDVVGTGKPLTVQVGSNCLAKCWMDLDSRWMAHFFQAECRITPHIMHRVIHSCDRECRTAQHWCPCYRWTAYGWPRTTGWYFRRIWCW